MSVSIPSNISTVTLTATSDALLNGGLVWASSDETKCTVVANGDTLSAVATRVGSGSAIITAFDAADNITGTIELDFIAAPTEITITATF